jgi:DNA polymerase III alpha subunit
MSSAPAYAELHCHSHFSFLDGASAPDELVDRAVALGVTGLAVTDHNGLYGVVRFASAAREVGLRPIVGLEIELVDALVEDPRGVVVPARRAVQHARPTVDEVGPPVFGRPIRPKRLGRGRRADEEERRPLEGRPDRPRPKRARLPGHRSFVKEDLRGIGAGQRGPHLLLLALDDDGYRTLCRLVSKANLSGTKAVPRFTQALLAEHTEGLVALSGCRESELARRLRVGDRAGARTVAERYAWLFGRRGAGASAGSSAASSRGGVAGAGFVVELQHHLLPDDDWLVGESAQLAAEVGLPVVVTNDVHYAHADGRELQDVVTAIRHGRTLDTLADLRRADGESYLKSGAELLAMPPGDAGGRAADPATARAWEEGVRNAGELAAATSVELGFERYRFPGFPVPAGETPFSYLQQLCYDGARHRYHPMTPDVFSQLAHELNVIQKTGLAEFFLICWDIMRFARSVQIPAQGRGSAADSIVAYVLGITRVDPIRHKLLFERFINEGRTTYPDVDIDFSNERREEVIQYVYGRYGVAHTGMVCNLVTYRARSAVREVGYALGFPRPLVDRVAKALETYDSVMVRRDLEADGGFASFFVRPDSSPAADGVAAAADAAGEHGLTDPMGQLRHGRGGRMSAVAVERTGRLVRKGDEGRAESPSFRPALPVVQRGTEAVEQSVLPSGTTPIADAGDVGGGGPHTTPGAGIQQERAETAMPIRIPLATEKSALPAAQGRDEAPFAAVIPLRTEFPSIPGPNMAGAGPSADASVQGSAGSGTSDDIEGVAAGNDSDSADDDPDNPAWTPVPGALPDALAPRTTIRGGGLSDDKGGPGDSPVSVAWLRALNRGGHPGGHGPRGAPRARGGQSGEHRMSYEGATDTIDHLLPPPTINGHTIDPESGMFLAPDRVADGRLPGLSVARAGLTGGAMFGPATPPVKTLGRADKPVSKVARVEPEPPPERRIGTTRNLSDWERWLEFCARMDGFPRHLSIHSGGMLVTAAPLIDIAPIERATMPNRVVTQYDKRDVETLKLIKLDLLGLGMLAAIDTTLQLIEHDCAVCLDMDRLPEEIQEVFAMLQSADTVGVFQVESRAQMQTLPKSRPMSLDDLVVEVAIIRPGPIQGNAVHPYLRRKQGLEPVQYLHPALEPVLNDTLGVILYQEQVMEIAIRVAGFSAADSDGFRRAMGTWRSTREMEKLHKRFVDGCVELSGMEPDAAEELFRQVSAFASFGFAKSHAAAFARTAYESSFLKLFYPAQFTVGLINAQPMGFYPVEVLVNDAKRHGVPVLPVDINASTYQTATEWVGRPGWALAGEAGDDGSHDADPGEPLPRAAGITRRPSPVRSSACVNPSAAARRQWAAESAVGYGIRLGLRLVKGIGEEHEAHLDAELARGPYRSLQDVVARTGLSEEVIERLIRTGALDSLDRPRRELLWQLREISGASRGRVDGRMARMIGRATKRAAGRPMDLRLPATPAPPLPEISERDRLGDSYAVISLDARKQVMELFRPALERLGAIRNAELADRPPGPVRLGGLVVTRQHPMTARGTVFLALEDESGMVNVTLWPDTWARLRGIVRRHALLLVDGMLQREGNVVNVIARDVRPLVEEAGKVGGPESAPGVRQLGYAGMRKMS